MIGLGYQGIVPRAAKFSSSIVPEFQGWLVMQESANVDDRHVNKPNQEGNSMAQSNVNADGSSDSIELGLPHEPLSITFFKTAFSITGLGLPGKPSSLVCLTKLKARRNAEACKRKQPNNLTYPSLT